MRKGRKVQLAKQYPATFAASDSAETALQHSQCFRVLGMSERCTRRHNLTKAPYRRWNRPARCLSAVIWQDASWNIVISAEAG